MEKLIIALDQGTSSSRAIAFDHKGSTRAISQQDFRQIYPQDGWVEHDPEDIWQSQLSCLQSVTEEIGGSEQIAAIGITNQRETAVVWNRQTGKAIHNAIVWQDRRTAERCEQLKASPEAAKIQQKTGLIIDSYFSATKVEWLLNHVDGARSLADAGELAFGTIDSWLVWKLSGGRQHVTDYSNAARTMLFDIHKGRWDEDLLKIFNIPKTMLPAVVESSAVTAETCPQATGLQCKIAGIAGDQHAALFGQLALRPGMIKNTYGTGCFAMMNTGDKAMVSDHRLLTTIAWRLEGKTTYALEGGVFIAGALIQWLRDDLGLFTEAGETESLANSVDDCGGVTIIPAFVGLGAPHWNPYARGMICGLTRATKPAHLIRAALEAIALQSYDLIETMKKDSGLVIENLRVDGGASENKVLMQMQADFLQTEVVRPKILETTALGAAFFAGLAVGFWDDVDALKGLWQQEASFTSDMPEERRAATLERWRHALRMVQTK